MKSSNQDISKSIKAKNFKISQLIGDDEKITWSNLKKKKIVKIFLELLPFVNHVKKISWSFKLGQLIEDDE